VRHADFHLKLKHRCAVSDPNSTTSMSIFQVTLLFGSQI